MTDRACIRGCTIRDVHYATCEHSGPTYAGAFPCRGCAPRQCRDGSLICDTAPPATAIVEGFDRIETAPKEWWNTPEGLTLNRPISIGGLAVNATRICTIDGCTRKHHARGLCTLHWQRRAKTGSTELQARPSMEDRFWTKVQPTGFCWEWTAYRDANGYGMFNVGGKRIMDRAHRVAYELLIGPIPAGHAIDHLCRNRGCCNPDHLEAVSAAENTRRNFAPGPVTARTGMCRRGHSMEDAYTRPDGKGRQCAECIRIRTARATEKRRRQNA